MRFRKQHDGREDEVSKATMLVPQDDGQTRQEAKAECDINTILRRYGLPTPNKSPLYITTDDTIDLQTALATLDMVKELPNAVPKELRGRYPTWRHILHATENGAYQRDLIELEKQRKAEEDRRAQQQVTT